MNPKENRFRPVPAPNKALLWAMWWPFAVILTLIAAPLEACGWLGDQVVDFGYWLQRQLRKIATPKQ